MFLFLFLKTTILRNYIREIRSIQKLYKKVKSFITWSFFHSEQFEKILLYILSLTIYNQWYYAWSMFNIFNLQNMYSLHVWTYLLTEKSFNKYVISKCIFISLWPCLCFPLCISISLSVSISLSLFFYFFLCIRCIQKSWWILSCFFITMHGWYHVQK